MPLFNKAVVKMEKGCYLTEEEWKEVVKDQDGDDDLADREYQEITISLEEAERISAVLLGNPDQYSDADKDWSEVQDECD